MRINIVDWLMMMMMMMGYEKGQLWGWRPKSTRSRDLGSTLPLRPTAAIWRQLLSRYMLSRFGQPIYVRCILF